MMCLYLACCRVLIHLARFLLINLPRLLAAANNGAAVQTEIREKLLAMYQAHSVECVSVFGFKTQVCLFSAARTHHPATRQASTAAGQQ